MSQNSRPMFTVFTPTYNREKTLPRVYSSLCAQTFRDFEWIVVDDGSQDHTEKLVKQWQSEADFPIYYFHQKNQGKHVAFNKGVELAKGEFFLPADSDDAFVENALERFNFHWNSIPAQKREQFSAVCVNCMDEPGKLIGTPFPKSPLDSDPEEIFFRYKVKGDKWGFHKTEALKKFPFPEHEEIPFVPESYVWFRLARAYKTRFINEELYVCYGDSGNQLTKRAIFDRAKSRVFYADLLNHSKKWFWSAPWIIYKWAVQYVRFCLLSKEKINVFFGRIDTVMLKILLIFATPLSFCLFLIDKYKK